MALLAAAAHGGAGIAQGVAVRALGDLVAERLRRDGHGNAWQEFLRNPQNDSLVRHLLQQALYQDAGFRTRFDEVLRTAARQQPYNSGKQIIEIKGPGEAQIGDRGDMISNSRVATRGGSYHEGDINNQNTRITHKKTNNGKSFVLGVVALVAIVLGVMIIKGIASAVGSATSGLTANSTCAQFLNVDPQTQQQALVDIAMSKGIGGFGSPLALPEISYECSSQPAMTLGALIERDKGEF